MSLFAIPSRVSAHLNPLKPQVLSAPEPLGSNFPQDADKDTLNTNSFEIVAGEGGDGGAADEQGKVHRDPNKLKNMIPPDADKDPVHSNSLEIENIKIDDGAAAVERGEIHHDPDKVENTILQDTDKNPSSLRLG